VPSSTVAAAVASSKLFSTKRALARNRREQAPAGELRRAPREKQQRPAGIKAQQ